MSSIYIDSFPSSFSTVEVENEESKRFKFIAGFNPSEINNQLIERSAIAFFQSILIHDQIYIHQSNIPDLISITGLLSFKRLLEEKIIKIIDDQNIPILIKEEKFILSSVEKQDRFIEEFEKKLKSLNIPSIEKSKIIQYTDNSIVKINESIFPILKTEIDKDLTYLIFKENGLTSGNSSEINQEDAYKILRIANIANGLITQNKLGIKSIYQDGFSKFYLDKKINFFSSAPSKESISNFQKIPQVKSIPDIYHLYKNSVLDINTIIEIRNNFNGKIFRKWYESIDYDSEETISQLVQNNRRGLKSSLARFIYPQAIGFINPIAGLLASSIDSFLVEKILSGWNPRMFLDDIYKRKIDEKIETNEKEKRRYLHEIWSSWT